MFRSPFADTDFELRAWHAVSMIGMIGGVIAFFVFHRSRPLPPPQSLAGCYTADRSPAIKLSGDRIVIAQPGFPPQKFHIEWTKQVPIVIVTEPSIGLTVQADGSLLFSVLADQDYTLYPAHSVDGKIYGVPNPAEREFIAARDSDLRLHIFKPADASACRGL